MQKHWEYVRKVFSLCEKYGDLKKIEGLRKTHAWGMVVPTQSSKKILFRVESHGRYHNVVVWYDGEVIKVRCGDTFLHNHGFEESYCWFEKNEKKGIPHCKHVAFFLQEILNDPSQMKWIEETLGIKKEVEVNLKSVEGKIKLAIKLSKPLLIYGPTGSGKTHTVLQAVKEEGIPLYVINISNGLEDVDLLQKLIPDPESGKWQRIEGELVKAFRHAQKEKVCILLEEITRSSKSLRNLILKAMDKKDGCYTLHDFTSGEYLQVPAENLVWVATANLGSSYGDTSELDPALMRRFSITVFMDYDTQKEEEILTKIVGEMMAKKMVEFARKIRENYLSGRLPYPLDTGSLVEWAELTKEIEDPILAAEMSFLYRIVERDTFGYPEVAQLEAIKEELEKMF